ncbi:MAG TPA: endonuclease III [Gemmatimonadales bacterium]|jgi:endonuclease-3|nr:endonuclease III [Gemmatimonadales bacterium]
MKAASVLARRRAAIRRESKAARQRRAAKIFTRLVAEYPDAHCELDYRTPYQLLVATILSAQCTDVRVNLVTPAFFARYPTPRALAGAERQDVEELIRSTGFFRNKAKSLIGMAQALTERHGGEVPREMETLRALPGVGRKTANVILGNAYGINEGVTVDTHVARLAARLRLSGQQTPERIERDLMALFPLEEWTLLSHLLIWHGRRICLARTPRCERCVVNELCPSARVPRQAHSP